MSTESRIRAWIEVDGSALRRNLEAIREKLGSGPALIPMVKADAYGLGVGPAVTAFEPAEPWGYGVATVAEGVELRALGVERPILVVCPVAPAQVEEAVFQGLTLSLSELETVDRLARAVRRTGRSATFHLEVDTGMGRAGLLWRDAAAWGPALKARVEATGVRPSGAYTHFHSADQVSPETLEIQWERFGDALVAAGLSPGEVLTHACNSAALLRKPEYAAQGVRPGIFLYGGRPGVGLPPPEPVMSLRGRILLVRKVPPGTTVGYGATHRAERWERWATVGLGYGDGLPRALSHQGQALVRGRRVPIVGRISMDMTVVDITGVPEVTTGEVVTFVGRDGEEGVSLEEVAEWSGTNNYEILTGFTPRLPRVWSEEGSG